MANGYNSMQSDRVVSALESDDDFDRERLENVRPPNWVNPTPLDRYKFLIIGAGPAGHRPQLQLVGRPAADELPSQDQALARALENHPDIVAAKAKVALVERELLGGDCLNVGCVPSKTIIRTAQLYAEMRKAQHYGAQVPAHIRVDFGAVMLRMRAVRARQLRGVVGAVHARSRSCRGLCSRSRR